LGPRVSQRPTKELNKKRRTNIKKPMKKGSNKTSEKVFGHNIERRSQKQFGHS
jgi:hypothetical protein